MATNNNTMFTPKWIEHPLPGIYKDDKGRPVDAVLIAAPTEVIKPASKKATGIPTAKYEYGYLVDTKTSDLYSLQINQVTGEKSWNLVE